ncbi:NAD-dependent protein lipoamidase sirtuin-4 [Actinomortierella ambigua]|uniref:NAD-dependent protein lipoamidase sirtuin-4 n=1 Tax=Actinomortierella ambigua TaxID=1343610 RepID=A0A9P6TZ69_9FUNG|nr:NAD-dependent protein lipoamidase sirtuin-4 [Actinomortierella ambigua]
MRMRLSLRSLTNLVDPHHSRSVHIPFPTAVQQLADFIRDADGRLVVLTGAGVSTDSNIPDYRGPQGTYTLNPEYQPVFYQAFRDSNAARHRYWARSFLGFPPVVRAKPNPTHYGIAALQTGNISLQDGTAKAAASLAVESPSLRPPPSPVRGNAASAAAAAAAAAARRRHVQSLITQNVDGLHQKAGAHDVIELHGSLHRVHCMKCGHKEDRAEFQHVLAGLNPEWDQLAKELSAGQLSSRMNADGDVQLDHKHDHQADGGDDGKGDNQERPRVAAQDSSSSASTRNSLDYRYFKYPNCRQCGVGHYKPSVVYFGENIPPATKERATDAVRDASALLVMGTSLATYSAYRLVAQAKEQGIPIAMVNLGATRGDPMANLVLDESSSAIMKAVCVELGLGSIPGEIRPLQRILNVVGS